MTEDDLGELLRDCPVLYHMAARGSWESIQRHGLLSTSALLDLFGVMGDRREGHRGAATAGERCYRGSWAWARGGA